MKLKVLAFHLYIFPAKVASNENAICWDSETSDSEIKTKTRQSDAHGLGEEEQKQWNGTHGDRTQRELVYKGER